MTKKEKNDLSNNLRQWVNLARLGDKTEVRPYLKGTYLSPEACVATDTHRMHVWKANGTPLPYASAYVEAPDGQSLGTEFPTWERIVPNRADMGELMVDAPALRLALKSLEPAAKQASDRIVLAPDFEAKRLTLSVGFDGFVGVEAQIALTDAFREDWFPPKIAVNLKYLQDVVKFPVGGLDKALIAATGPTNPMLIMPTYDPEHLFAVVMPMAL